MNVPSPRFLSFVACLLPFFVAPLRSADSCDFPQFAAARAYPIGGVGFSIAAGDFNRDGKADIAVAVGQAQDNVRIFLGRGDGGMSAADSYTVATFPDSIQSIDMNSDGAEDLVVKAATKLWILRGRGNGTFQPAEEVPGIAGVSFAVGKFNSDTNLDFAIAQSIFLNIRNSNSNGTFKADLVQTIRPGEGVVSVAVGDMNRDGRDDIVAGTSSPDEGRLAILLGSGEGNFLAPLPMLAGTNNSILLLGDFNQDKDTDVAVGDYAGSLSIFLGRGDGTLRSNTVIALEPQLTSMALADFNGDGTNDIAVATGKSVTILQGREGGTFVPTARYDDLWRTVATADFNSDGRLDLVSNLGSDKIGVALGRGDGTFLDAPHYPLGTNSQSIVLGDLNNDGHLDIAVANLESDNISVLLNKGDGSFEPSIQYSTPDAPQALAIADINRDGTNDVIVTTVAGTNQFSVLLGQGHGVLKQASLYGMFGGGPLAVADFNGDGKLDVLANDLIKGLQVHIGNGSGGFTPASAGTSLNAFAYGPSTLAVADFNADTKLDFVLAKSSGNMVSVGLGQGNALFSPPVDYASGTNCEAVIVADLNHDGTPDIAVANSGTFLQGDGAISILLGAGDGTFAPAKHIPAGPDPTSLAAADLNGDGRLDLVVRGHLGFGMGVLLGKADGTFGPIEYFGSLNDGLYAGVALGDLNGDAKPDAALLNLGSSVAIMLNRCAATVSTRPALAVFRNDTSIIIEWPANFAAAKIQSTPDLSALDWNLVSGPTTTIGDVLRMTLPLSGPAQFFRLMFN